MNGRGLPLVSVFSLGGTIAATVEPDGGAGVTPRLAAADLIAAVPGLPSVAEVEPTTFRQVPSSDLTFDDVVRLVLEIRDRLDTGADGVVVTQGTDSIEETAFALDLLVARVRPVVVTGAMRNPTKAGADGPGNLLAAVQVAAAPAASGLGTLVVLNDQIHAARFVRKTHTASPATFRSASAGPLGWVAEGRPRIALRPAPLPQIALPALGESPRVALLTMALGDDDGLIEQIDSLGYSGLVIEAFGGGHVPARVVPALEFLAERIPVVLASRTGAGEGLRETYRFGGSERDLLSRGLIPAGFLDGLKARVLLTLVLAAGADEWRVRQVFAEVNGA